MLADAARTFDGILEKQPLGLTWHRQKSLLEDLLPTASTLQKLAVALLFVGILVAMGRARFYLPDNSVPITFQTFGVLATGGILGIRWGLFSILLWYFLGMAGVPVFQGGGNGWAYLSGGVTGGYIIGFIAATWLVGYLSQNGWGRGRILWPMLLGSLLIYVPGLLWLHYFDFSWPPEGQIFAKGMYPFMAGDLVKLMAAALVVGGLSSVADRRRG